MIHKRSIVLLKILVLLVPIVISFEVSQNEVKKDSKTYLGKEFRYSVRRLIGSLWANIKVITITD
jgi:hypothetical protein